MNLATLKKELRPLIDYHNYAPQALILSPLLAGAGASLYFEQPVNTIILAYGWTAFTLAFAPATMEHREEKLKQRWDQFLKEQPKGLPLSIEEIEQLPESLDGFIAIIEREGLPKIIEFGTRANLYQPILARYAAKAGIEPPDRI